MTLKIVCRENPLEEDHRSFTQGITVTGSVRHIMDETGMHQEFLDVPGNLKLLSRDTSVFCLECGEQAAVVVED